ncbi:MAG TPA: patatin-like phospholipase family protein [Gammaproteobacteria bacterium]|nr:patatin-like phospholipase family protein [Gammaproteobacteria bacterium]
MQRETDRPTLREWLSAGPFALALSSGFFGFFAHCGALSVLEEEHLLPARLGSSSAGALVAAAWAAGLDSLRLGSILLGLRRSDFWDPVPGPGLLRGRRFRDLLRGALPADTFEGCRRPVALSAYDVLQRRTRVFERGALVPAIRASCAVPLLFHPVWIDRRPYLDGGIADRPGLAGLPAAPRVLYHHLASRRRQRGGRAGLPARPGLLTLAVPDLPRTGPHRLQAGRHAFECARSAMRLALDRPVAGAVLRVPGDPGSPLCPAGA